LLIFSGDAFAPSKISRLKQGWQMVHCLKMLNIDVACYGNHDFDYSPEHSLELARACGFPWLMGNIKYLETGKNIGEGLDYHILTHEGIKIGFLGLAGPDFNGRLISAYKSKMKYYECR
jgi:5'-nucleotidase